MPEVLLKPQLGVRRLPEVLLKARGVAELESSARPAGKAGPAGLARAEILDKATRARLEAELDAAINRRPSNERKLAGVLRTLAPLSAPLRAAMADATETFLRRGTLDRDLYGACVRSLGETRDKSVTALLKRALVLDSAGGAAALSAACFSTDPALGPSLARVAAGGKAHLAFAAETARVARGESNGAHLASLAPMIKESHRLTLCADIFVPLARAGATPLGLGNGLVKAGPALTVLRGAERHLGRWLTLGEVAVAAGDLTPLEEARSRSTSGPSSARSAWSLVAWALEERARATDGVARRTPPTTRPTVEIVSRLSDRPSADRDATFLFRMARAGMPSARPMLETLAKELPLSNEVAVRAAVFLARDHGRKDLAAALLETASSEKKEDLRGLATAALCDLGDPAMLAEARRLSAELLQSRSVVNVAWGVLVRALASRGTGTSAGSDGVVSETAFRWMQWGWLE
jgi:hypothetical protein